MRVGPYLVDGEHRKEGGQAFVYFGAGGDEQVAVKVARPSNWSRQRLKREIAVQTRLDHPNVLKIIRHDTELGWYAMNRALGSPRSGGSPHGVRDSFETRAAHPVTIN